MSGVRSRSISVGQFALTESVGSDRATQQEPMVVFELFLLKATDAAPRRCCRGALQSGCAALVTLRPIRYLVTKCLQTRCFEMRKFSVLLQQIETAGSKSSLWG